MQQPSLFMVDDDVAITTRAPVKPCFHHKQL
jgi:hypothetical protein